MYFADLRMSKKSQKILEVHKSQIRKVPRLRKIRKSNQGRVGFSPPADGKNEGIDVLIPLTTKILGI